MRFKEAMGVKRWGLAALAAAVTAFGVGAAPARAADPPPKVDVMFLVDTTGSMSSAISEVRSEIGDVMQRIGGGGPDAAFGLAQMRDLDPDSGFSYKLEQGITTDRGAVSAATGRLSANGGGDGPEAYGPALAQADSGATGWRPDARRLLVVVADNVPHDDDLNERIPADEQTQSSPFDTRTRDSAGAPTGDLSDWQSQLDRLREDGLPIVFVYYHGASDYLPYWARWASWTGGISGEAGPQLEETIVNLVTQGEHTELPPCASSGDVRQPDGHCGPPAPSGSGGGGPSGGGDQPPPYGCTALAGGGFRCSPPTCTSPAAASYRAAAPPAQGGQPAAFLNKPEDAPAKPPFPGLTDQAKQLTQNCRVTLAFGDSVTSGHNIDHFGTLYCEDITYSYPFWAWQTMRGRDPWKTSPLVNAAYSGFGTQEVLNAGTNACKTQSSRKPIDVLTDALKAHLPPDGTEIGRGNVVMGSVGINNAPWTDKLLDIIASRKRVNVHIRNLLRDPEAVVEDMAPDDCEAILKKVWDPVVGKHKDEIVNDAKTITSTLVGADKTVKVYWLKYYDFAGSGSVRVPVKVPGFKAREIRVGPLLPKGCFKPFDKRRDEINQWVESGVAQADGKEHPHVAFVDTSKLDGNDRLMQPLVVGKGVLREIEKAILGAADKVVGGALEKFGAELDKARTALEKEEAALKGKQDALDALEKELAKETDKVKRAALEVKIKAEKLAVAAAEKLVAAARVVVTDLEKKVAKLDERLEANIDPSAWGFSKGHEVGWPHPNIDGHKTIAAEVVKLLPAAK